MQEGVEKLVLWQRAAPISATEAETHAFCKQLQTRVQVAGGEVIARAGASLVAAFDPLELDDVVDLVLGLLDEAAAKTQRIELSCALALGELVEEDGVTTGGAIDRAQRLANVCETFELVLDDAAHARAEDNYLFVRALRAGEVSGRTLDRNHPRKIETRHALSSVSGPVLPKGSQTKFDHVLELAARPGQQRVALRAQQSHIALFWIDLLCALAEPSLVLQLGPQAASLQPLGGLQLALRRASASLDPLVDPPLADALSRLARGDAVPRKEAVHSLRELLQCAGANGKRAFVVLDRMREIDRPSLAVVAEALQQPCGDPVLWLVADEHEVIPSSLLRASVHDDLSIEALSIDDRARVAEAALGLASRSDIALRVARLGGDSVLGVWTAARTLVSSGDLVLDASGAFRWRNKARHASLPVPIDALLTECAGGLQPNALRVLEALCVAPPAIGLHTIARIAELDGLTADKAAQGIEQLLREGWIDARGELGALRHAKTSAVRNGMPPARAAELHRFVADVLLDDPTFGERPAFARALLAHHLAEGGRDRDAAHALLDAAQATTESGFDRMAVRLAAFALKLDRSVETKQRARFVARTIDTGPVQSSLPPVRPPTAPPAPASREPREIAAAAIQEAISVDRARRARGRRGPDRHRGRRRLGPRQRATLVVDRATRQGRCARRGAHAQAGACRNRQRRHAKPRGARRRVDPARGRRVRGRGALRARSPRRGAPRPRGAGRTRGARAALGVLSRAWPRIGCRTFGGRSRRELIRLFHAAGSVRSLGAPLG